MDGIQILSFPKATNPSRQTLSSLSAPSVLFSPEYTIKKPISCSGIGLHTGQHINIRLLPAPAKTGIVFRRVDKNNLLIKALYTNVVDTTLSTVIASSAFPEIKIATIEHLMAALAGNQINNIIIECDGSELPVLDGSSIQFNFLLEEAGRQALASTSLALKIMKPVKVEHNGAFAELKPSSHDFLSLSLSINFSATVIGQQQFEMRLTPQNFKHHLAYCRTFTFKEEIDTLHKMGLAKGGSLDNAIVVENDKIVNPDGLRCKDEFVRHKMLDAIGDLSLLNCHIHGHFIGFKSGHTLNNMLLRKLMSEQNNYRYISKLTSPSYLLNPMLTKTYGRQEA